MNRYTNKGIYTCMNKYSVICANIIINKYNIITPLYMIVGGGALITWGMVFLHRIS